MAADVGIFEWNGAVGSPSKTDKTNTTVRFKKADDANIDANDPIPAPPSGSVVSYEKYLRLRTKTQGPTTQINNIQFYTDGTNNFGTGVTVDAKMVAGASYAQPSDTEDVTDSDVFAYTSASPLSLGAGPFTPGANTDFGDFVKLQMKVDSTVSAPRVLNAETVTFSFLES